ncbi:MAG: HNH endonuclease [Mycobacterium sp.]
MCAARHAARGICARAESRSRASRSRASSAGAWPAESVHHRNGVRDDNRPENLELWTRPQPTDIRVSDAIAWAHEILALYTGASDTSNNAQGRP